MSEYQEEEEFEVEVIDDTYLLLLSYTQMMAVELIAADDEALAAKSDLAETLQTRFVITDIVLKQRDFEHYVVGYREKNKEKTIRFDTDEVESIYDL